MLAAPVAIAVALLLGALSYRGRPTLHLVRRNCIFKLSRRRPPMHLFLLRDCIRVSFCQCFQFLARHPRRISYLLMPTFAHGRLANPTHQCGSASKRFMSIVPNLFFDVPPLKALRSRSPSARFSVDWLVLTAAAMRAVCWMLRAWMPTRWAFCGTLVR